jgi:hypothetical protein
MNLVALILTALSFPCALLAACRRLSMRTRQLLTLAFGGFAVTGSTIWVTLDAQAGSLLGVVLWLILIGAVDCTTCWGWKLARQEAAEAR